MKPGFGWPAGASGGGVDDGYLRITGGVAIDSTLRRVQNTTNSILYLSTNNIAAVAPTVTTSADGFSFLTSATVAGGLAATALVPVQISPRTRWQSTVWNTTITAASNTSDFIFENIPTSGATPVARMALSSSLVATAGYTPSYTEQFAFYNNGNFSMGGTSLVMQYGGFTGTISWAPSSSNKTITLPNATGTVTLTSGALTPGSVIFAGSAGILAQDNSNFFWDDTNNFLGVGNAAPISEFHVYSTSTAANRGITFEQGTSDALGARVNLLKRRSGVITTGDVLGRIAAWGYDGTNYLLSGQISFNSTGTIGTGIVPTTITFSTATAAGVLTLALTIGSDQSLSHVSAITTGPGFTGTYNSLTTGIGMLLTTSSITTGSLLNLVSTSTVENGSSLLNISSSGANGTASKTTYGGYIANTHTGTTSTNVALYLTASGATNNYGLIVAAGSVGIGKTAPAFLLDILGAATTGVSIVSQAVGGTSASAGGLKFGAYDGNAGGIWSAAVATPSTSNYAVYADSTQTVLHATTTVYVSLATIAKATYTANDTTFEQSNVTGSSSSVGFTFKRTWNTSGTPTMIKAILTNTGSNAAALIVDLVAGTVGTTSMFSVSALGKLKAASLPTSNSGLVTGEFYVDSAANILANGDKVVGWKV